MPLSTVSAIHGKTMKKIIPIAALLILLSSCQKLLFNDVDETREISTGKFSAVRVNGIYNLVLVQDSTDRIIITGSNDIGAVDAVVKNDTLTIEDTKKFSLNPGRNTLEIHFSQLDHLVTYDPVYISVEDTVRADRMSWDAIGEIAEGSLALNCNLFIFCNSANTLGFITLSGKAELLVVFNRYGGSIFASGLSCKYADITNESAGDVHVNASELLTAYIWGPGNIYYSGDPLINIKEVKSSGNLIRLR